MQYTDGIGIQATQTDLVALLAFAKDDKDAKISVRVENGKLLAWATCGSAAVYHHGETWNGSGKPSQSCHNWQISTDAIEMIKKGMSSGDEVFFRTDSKLSIFDAEIRSIDTAEKKPPIGLDGFVCEQLELDLPAFIPDRPGRRTGEVPASAVASAFTVLEKLKKVCKAADTEAARFYSPSDPHKPVYVEVDKPSRLSDEEQPRWVAVLMPLRLEEAAVSDVRDDDLESN